MKYIVLTLLLSISIVSPCRSADDPLTAPELAHHLGISSWVSKFRLQGSDFEVQILHVKNGKVVGTLVGSSAISTDREFTRIAIEASQSPSGTKLSIQTASGPWSMRQHTATIPLDMIVPLPQSLAVGDYVLGGDIPADKFGQGKPPVKIEDIKDGILLRVTKGA